MADFRNCIFAFAAAALLSGLAIPSNAQIQTPALQCVANAGVPPIVRAEGLAELVGDLTLNCTGGTPTPAGQTVPQTNIQIFLNTNVTSRILNTAGNFDEALLIIDEPHSSSNPTRPLLACGDAGAPDSGPSGAGVCSITSIGNPVLTYDGTPGGVAYGTGRPNVYQGRQNGVNSIVWLGVPIDPPGTATSRIIRITNVRANANNLGVSSTLVPSQIVANISVNGSTALPINNPQQTLAYIQPGLVTSVRFPFNFVQCLSANPNIASNPGSPVEAGGQNGQQFSIRFDEGFASSWKVKNLSQALANGSGLTPASLYGAYNGGVNYPADENQNVPGAIYNTESGFENSQSATDPVPNPPNSAGFGVVGPTAPFPTKNGLTNAGIATQGTRLAINFASTPQGSQLFVPTRINVVRQSDGATTGVAVLTSTDGNGAGGYSPLAGGGSGLAPVSLANGAGFAVYEILYSDPFSLERLNVPVAVAFVSNSGNNLPAPGVQATATSGFAPISNVGTADSFSPVPRFVPGTPARNTFLVNKCSCNLLFPFVTNQSGFDTGVAIANTSLDPYGTTPQTGNVTLNYYGGTTGGGAAPAAQTTNAPVPGGAELIFTLSGGGNFGVAATPGFQGYIIAQAQFQFCHAFAFISDVGSQRIAEGYLAIQLDVPGLDRTFQLGENKAH